MWKRIKKTDLFIKLSEEYDILVTDFVTVWFSYLSNTSFIRCLKESNILLEMADDALVQKGKHVLSNPSDIKNVVHNIDNKVLVISMTMLFGYPFKVNLKLCEGSKELFFLKVTQPLLRTISELKSSQVELCELLNKKDSEIEEYKQMGGEIAIKFLKTKPFDEGALKSKYKMYKGYFGDSDDTVVGLVNIKPQVPEDTTNVKMEPVQCEESTRVQSTIKLEPNSQITENAAMGTSLVSVKQEIESPIKRESQSIMNNGRKRMKKLNL